LGAGSGWTTTGGSTTTTGGVVGTAIAQRLAVENKSTRARRIPTFAFFTINNPPK